MDDKDDFCPNCKSILNPIEASYEDIAQGGSELPPPKQDVGAKGLYMRCDECGFARPTQSFSTIHFTKHEKKTGAVKSEPNMNPERIADLIYEKTYPVTRELSCVNKKCPSYQEGKNPEIMTITSDERPELGYICVECKAIWGRF